MTKRSRSETGAASDRQGIVGQKRFAVWAAEAGVTANPADEDRAGWDFVVDLPPAVAHERALTCKVQVKTLGPDATSAPIKLSNWRTMIWDALAWFIVMIRVRADGTTEEIRLVSIEGAVIDEAVKALSKVKGKSRLNRKSLAVRADRGTQLAGGKPELGLFAAMRKAIGDPLAHVRKKMETLDAARRATPESHGTLVMQFRTEPDFFQDAAEFAVGLRSKLPFERFTFSERVLGVAGKALEHDKGGTLELSPLPTMDKARIVVSHPSTGARVSRAFDYQSSMRVFPFLPEQYALIRLTSPLVSVLFKVATRGVSFQWTSEPLRQRVDPQVLGDAADFFLELSSFPLPDSRLDVTLPQVAEPLIVTNVAAHEMKVGPALREDLATFRDAWRILQRLGVTTDLVEATALLRQRSSVRTIASVLFGNPYHWGISCEVSEPDELIAEGKPVAYLFVPGFTTVQHAVLAAIAICGVPHRVEGTNRIEISAPAAEIVGTEVVALAKAKDAVTILRERCDKALDARGAAVIINA